VATQTVARQHDIGVFFSSIPELRQRLADAPRMAQLRENSWQRRLYSMFDRHADGLSAFFREALRQRAGR